jgi:transglutaminase-like putative cysteine protease
MRILVSHHTHYRYEQAANGVIQVLRLTPRHHEGQYIVRWRLDLSHDGRLEQREDAFGNIVHAFTLAGPIEEIWVLVEGEVETQDTAGVVRGSVERFPPSLYLRETAVTQPDPAIAAFAAEIAMQKGDPIGRLHLLLATLHRDIVFDTDPTHVHTTAAQAFALKRGVCQDLTHIFLVCARLMDIPARYVGGHLQRNDGVVEQAAGHAWAEAFVPELGWVGFDPTNGICMSEAHVRVASRRGARPRRPLRRQQ